MPAAPQGLTHAVSLSPFTSLKLGGVAEHFLEVTSQAELREALCWADAQSVPVSVLGCGSNLVIGDAGCAGLVVRMATRGIVATTEGEQVRLEVAAGEPWQHVVDYALSENLAGLECLTGIPGSTGATPIQNVGAYGQEVSSLIEAVQVLDRSTRTTTWLPAADCGFAYRHSRFKREPTRYIVLTVRFLLKRGMPSKVRYPELVRSLGDRGAQASLREVAEAVRSLRASKGMLIDRSDPDSQSAGSFFMNPIVPAAVAERVVQTALAHKLVARAEDVAHYAAGDGLRKLAAAWLIEKSGIKKGLRRGAVGVSSKHTLALVHYGGGTTRELLELAAEVQARVHEVFGVALQLEPVCWGVAEG